MEIGRSKGLEEAEWTWKTGCHSAPLVPGPLVGSAMPKGRPVLPTWTTAASEPE